VPQLKDLSEVKDEAGIPHLEAVYEHWRPMGQDSKKINSRMEHFV